MGAHARVPGMTPDHFDRWLTLFDEVAHDELASTQADDIVGRAHRMRRALEPHAVTGMPASPHL